MRPPPVDPVSGPVSGPAVEADAGIGRRAWVDLGGDPAALDRLGPVRPPVGLTAAVDVNALLGESAAVATLALASFDEQRNGAAPQRLTVDGDRIRTSAQSDHHLRIDGSAPEVWSPFSGFWRTADGWIRSHGNYPHHAARFAALLGLDTDADRKDVARATAQRSAIGLEDEAADVGAVVGAVRDQETWSAHPQAQATAQLPLIGWTEGSGGARHPGAGRLLAGVKVLDLTRVLAGPVAARSLAHAGAEVLRLDSPRLPEIAWQHVETGSGKRSALLDLTSSADRRLFWELLAEADVLLTGYRPGSLEARGLDFAGLQERRPGLIVGRVSAWGPVGPWAERRGFDSIVQAVTGIARRQGPDPQAPGALPAQALDHSAGHLLTAGVARALTTRLEDGVGREVQVALARVARAVLNTGPCRGPDPAGSPATTQEQTGDGSTIRIAGPPLQVPGAPADYPDPATPWGSDAPRWAAP